MRRHLSGHYIGIEFDKEFLKIAVHENNRICGELCEKIPEYLLLEGKWLSMESAAEFLRETGRKHGLSRYGACVVLPEEQVITKRCQMAAMDSKRLRLNLPYEFYDYLENSREEWIYDYCIASHSDLKKQADETLDLMAVAAPVRLVTWYQKLIRLAGWKLCAMAPVSSAFANLIRYHDRLTEVTGNCCIMECRKQGMTLYFYRNGLLFTKHEMKLGTEEELLFELEKTWDYYETSCPQQSPQRIYFTGDNRSCSYEQAIEKELDVEGCDWTELLVNHQSLTKNVSAAAAGMTFWRI